MLGAVDSMNKMNVKIRDTFCSCSVSATCSCQSFYQKYVHVLAWVYLFSDTGIFFHAAHDGAVYLV